MAMGVNASLCGQHVKLPEKLVKNAKTQERLKLLQQRILKNIITKA